MIRHRLLKRIVAGQHLSSFLYTPGYMQLEVNQGAAFSDDQITAYLDSSKHSLKRLVLHSTLDGGHPCIGKFDGLELLDMSYMTLVDNHESAEGHGIIERSLRLKLPNSLKKLVIDQLICEFDILFIAKEIAHLKIQGGLSNLEAVVLMIAGPHAMLMMGYPPWELCEMRDYIEDAVGEVFEKAKLGLAFGISR
ncbi:hypothetical protein N0V94_006401 [Neodidymelliopsis sp. IMI 364377]|nr:hypothetical protein N0V94_006401 [Neodidymelliopsis sp. IMI 364377]